MPSLWGSERSLSLHGALSRPCCVQQPSALKAQLCRDPSFNVPSSATCLCVELSGGETFRGSTWGWPLVCRCLTCVPIGGNKLQQEFLAFEVSFAFFCCDVFVSLELWEPAPGMYMAAAGTLGAAEFLYSF